MVLDTILIILNILCVIGAGFIVIATERNTKVRREQIKQLKKENELLDKLIKKADMISKLQASYEQVKEGEADENKEDH